MVEKLSSYEKFMANNKVRFTYSKALSKSCLKCSSVPSSLKISLENSKTFLASKLIANSVAYFWIYICSKRQVIIANAALVKDVCKVKQAKNILQKTIYGNRDSNKWRKMKDEKTGSVETIRINERSNAEILTNNNIPLTIRPHLNRK